MAACPPVPCAVGPVMLGLVTWENANKSFQSERRSKITTDFSAHILCLGEHVDLFRPADEMPKGTISPSQCPAMILLWLFCFGNTPQYCLMVLYIVGCCGPKWGAQEVQFFPLATNYSGWLLPFVCLCKPIKDIRVFLTSSFQKRDHDLGP